jgi:hypothetical protein
MLFGGHDVDLGCATKVSQSSFPQGTAHDRLDQTPRGRDLPANVNPRGINRIDDRSETESEITCGGVYRRQRFRVTTRAGDQIFDGETRFFCFGRSAYTREPKRLSRIFMFTGYFPPFNAALIAAWASGAITS